MIQSIIICLFTLTSPGEISSDSTLREAFHKNVLSTSQLQAIIESRNHRQNAVALAYKGVAQTMMAEKVFLPTSKLSAFGNGKRKIENAIKLNPSSIEIRYIRLLVQLNAPSILGYNDEIDEDFNLFLKHLYKEKLSKRWKLAFINNLIKSQNLSPQKKKILQETRTSLK